MEELCKCLLQKALSYVFVFHIHNTLFSGAHPTPLGNWDLPAGEVIWCIGREKFSALCGGCLSHHHLEKLIIVNSWALICLEPILSFLVIESLLLGGNPSLPLSPHNLSGLNLPPHCRVNVWLGLAPSVCALFRSGMVMWLTLGQWIQLWEICWNYWGKQALGLGHCEDIDL